MTAESSADTTCFALRLLPDPGALPRVLELFAKRGLVPSELHASLEGQGDEARQIVELQLNGMDSDKAEIIAEALRQIVVVERVLTRHERLDSQAA